MTREVVITGYAHHSARSAAPDFVAAQDPASLDFSGQIPNRSDLRAQGLSQLLGSYTAGLALDMAGLKGEAEILADADLMVATHFGERDRETDQAVLEAVCAEGAGEESLNRELSNLRPSLFLAQLQNLFAANISIVHGVLGTSITFMGETPAGARVVDEARRRVLCGRSEIILVGAVFNGLRPDILEVHDARAFGDDAEGEREGQGDEDRLALGFGAAFLLLESGEHAAKRGAGPRARLREMVQTRFEDALDAAALGLDPAAPLLVLHDATGKDHVGRVERRLRALAPDADIRNLAAVTGSLMEASFPFAASFAAGQLDRRSGAGGGQALICSTGPGPHGTLAVMKQEV